MSRVRSVALLDYGSGNLRSAARALTRAGADVRLITDPTAARDAAALVVPGVGAYAACMAGLRAIGADEVIRDWAARERPLLGICVGFQVLFDGGTEHGEHTDGCGVLAGEVWALEAIRLPHMGWNTVTPGPDSRYFTEPGERFYFVHSYGAPDAAATTGQPVTVTTAEHQGARFVAAVETSTLLGTQFHPEKSGDAGAWLLRRWVDGLV